MWTTKAQISLRIRAVPEDRFSRDEALMVSRLVRWRGSYGRPTMFKFQEDYSNLFCVQIFLMFIVLPETKDSVMVIKSL